MNRREQATAIYLKHIDLAATDGRLFRKTVMEELIETTGCSESSAATYYNHCKKDNPVAGLGREDKGKSSAKHRGPKHTNYQDDNDCFSVIEVVDGNVGRSQSFLYHGEAGEHFETRVGQWPKSQWVLLKGLGPHPGEDYKVAEGEKEVKRYLPPAPI